MPDKKIEIRSEEVQEIIGNPPSKIIRSGIAVLFITVIFLIIVSFQFKYPDVIKGSVILKGDNQPVSLKARESGKLIMLFVKDKEQVCEGQILAVIENTVCFEDYLYLKRITDSTEQNFVNIDSITDQKIFHKKLKLGELQPYYSELQKEYFSYLKFKELNYYEKKVKNLESQKKYLNEKVGNLKGQTGLYKYDIEMSLKQYKRDSILGIKGYLSETELERSKTRIISQKRNYEEHKYFIAESELKNNEIDLEITETSLKGFEEKRNYEIRICELIANMTAEIEKWEQRYLLISPIPGRVNFHNIRTVNQNVNKSETVLIIVPEKNEELAGYIDIPMKGAGKVKEHQYVNVKFDDYPYTEFGIVKARIESLSLVQSDGQYTARISFPDSLRTSYGNVLDFKQNMIGTADIITENIPLAVRIFQPIKSIFYEKMK